ncbi:MAG: DUF2207 domain-containing protein [Chloroflexi bacterium]|nr:DUF2207 domain-containing protein [Chloroflexota bacterium]
MRRSLAGWVIALAAAVAAGGFLVLTPNAAGAKEDWTIRSFDAQIEVGSDGSLQILEAIEVDFGSLQKHGIFRDIPVRYEHDRKQDRVVEVRVQRVTDAQERSHRYETSREGQYLRVKIGDPDRTISGRQTYRVAYTARGAVNGFPEHVELFWNAPGTWPVPILVGSARVRVNGAQRVACYQGPSGAREECRASEGEDGAVFSATRPLQEGEQLTVVVGFAKGVVSEPVLLFAGREREPEEFYEVTPVTITGMAAVAVASAVVLGGLYWRTGRDRRFRSLYYLTDNPAEETRGLFQRDQVVIEFEPPEGLKAAQMGVLLDERADTLDLTATLIDLAVRGYLKITPRSEGFLGFGKDWQLDQQKEPDESLMPYERRLLDGLFGGRGAVRISDLKGTYYTHLAAARDLLYLDVTRRGWFPGNPQGARRLWAVAGAIVAILGGLGSVVLGQTWGGGLIAVPLAVAGLILLALAKTMARRTALGSEMLRRTLGFRQYLVTAEKDRQQFNEQAGIFATYLPFAIVFNCVDRWARAFEGIDIAPAVATWYAGTGGFNAHAFGSQLGTFSSGVGGALASTPASRGSSGFSGGFSGGGFGGGRGGSW